MPPKKKPAPPQASTKNPQQESLQHQQEILTQEPTKKIPKRPHFRNNVDYHHQPTVQQIKTKLWKIHALKVNFTDEPGEFAKFSRTIAVQKRQNRRRKFFNTFQESTMKKSLNHLKNIKFNSKLLPESKPLHRLCGSLKLDSFHIVIHHKVHLDSLMKTFLKLKLKNCFLTLDMDGDDIDRKLISKFRILRKCNLFVNSTLNDFRMLLDADNIARCNKIYQFIKEKYQAGYEFIINTTKCLKENSSQCYDYPERENHITPDLPLLPGLQKFHFVWKIPGQHQEIADISLLKQYSTLQTLSIVNPNDIPGLRGYLADHLCFREFFFSLRQYNNIREGPPRSLTNLIKLEKIGIDLTSILQIKDVRDFLQKNQQLKTLDLSLSIKELGELFEDESFFLPNLENLQLNLTVVEKPYAGATKRIVQALKKHTSLKKVSLYVPHSNADLNAMLFKEGLAKMNSLEALDLKFRNTGGLEENKFKHLKDVLTNHVNLTSLELDLRSDAISSKEITPILDGLSKLRRLDKLKIVAQFTKLTPATFNKISDFLSSIRHIKNLTVFLKGFSEREELELKANVFPKSPLSNEFSGFCLNYTHTHLLQANLYS